MNDTSSQLAALLKPPKLRKYQSIWIEVASRADADNFEAVRVHVPNLTHEIFRRIRKAYWKERDLDPIRRLKWQCRVWRGMQADGSDKDIIYFSVRTKQIPLKDQI